jgi:hypothetical protein
MFVPHLWIYERCVPEWAFRNERHFHALAKFCHWLYTQGIFNVEPRKEQAMFRVHIDLDANQGLQVSGHISPIVLRTIISIAVGMVSLPWLGTLVDILGWL